MILASAISNSKIGWITQSGFGSCSLACGSAGGGVLKSMLTLNEAIIDVKEG